MSSMAAIAGSGDQAHTRYCAGSGPGAYVAEDITRNGRSLDWGATSHTHHSAFKAKPHQLTLLGNLEAPPPTKYTLVSTGYATTRSASFPLSASESHDPIRFTARPVGSPVVAQQGGIQDPVLRRLELLCRSLRVDLARPQQPSHVPRRSQGNGIVPCGSWWTSS